MDVFFENYKKKLVKRTIYSKSVYICMIFRDTCVGKT